MTRRARKEDAPRVPRHAAVGEPSGSPQGVWTKATWSRGPLLRPLAAEDPHDEGACCQEDVHRRRMARRDRRGGGPPPGPRDGGGKSEPPAGGAGGGGGR